MLTLPLHKAFEHLSVTQERSAMILPPLVPKSKLPSGGLRESILLGEVRKLHVAVVFPILTKFFS